ncbi:metalloendopeptidase [Coemansia interrupta]|uniref:Metalloendopeptidase n=1 Tax=Coemansia interrupta TaxID=1126814 RepID=A0A9W8H8M6_9FUNG|nr:metalloendopeptidase [Coemansia interrupta]
MHSTQLKTKGSELNFDLSPEDINQTVDRLIAESTAICDQIASEPNPTFETVILPFETCNNRQATDYNMVTFLQDVSTEKDVRDASAAATEKLEAYEIERDSRKDLYAAVNAVYNNKSEMDKLGNEDRRLVEKLILDFKNAGVALSDSDREQLTTYKKRLSEIKIQFERNVSTQVGRVLFTREELIGLPVSFFEDRATETVDGVAKYIVTTKTPDYLPVIRYAAIENTRRRISLANSQRCPENIALLQETVELRLKVAQLLGYKSYAELELSTKMAKTPKTAVDFLNDLRTKLNVLGKLELEQIEELKRAEKAAAGETYTDLFRWDSSYYSNIIKQREHSIDMEEIKEYFSLEAVTRGILDIYQNMLGLHFAKVENPSVWHPDVVLYEVWEADKESFLGHLYLDLFPRENKFSHAAMSHIRTGHSNHDGSFEYPASVMLANFPKATSSTPALMQHSDVVTLMHELGHAFHRICSRTKWSRFHGTSVERDFVEAPSQMLENWAWEPSVLRRFAVHYKTGELIPEDLIKRLVASKNHNAGLGNLFQVAMALYDMKIHMIEDGTIDVKAVYNDIRDEVSHYKSGDEDSWTVATFAHLIGGYSAGYYGYLWSEVYSADMFETRFLKNGIDNPHTGMDYRREILFPGGSRDASVSLEKFLGRKPDSSAYMRSIGLASD